MIHSIEIKDKSKVFKYYTRELNLPDKIEFKPGLNIIIGSNGCGKTTMMDILRTYHFCDSLYYSNPDKNEIRKLSKNGVDRVFQDGAIVKSNYKIPCFNLRFSEKLNDGNSLTNFTNFSQTYYSKNSSSGEDNWYSFTQLFKVMFEENHISGYDVFKNMSDENIIKYYKDNQVDDYIFTIFMDEPDRSLDIDKLNELYNIITFPREDTQIIIILHNPALIYRLYKDGKYNFIEFEKNYLTKILNFLEK